MNNQKAISDRVRNSKKYKTIRQSLIDQLKANGSDNAFFRDMVEDYMQFWVIKYMTTIDIRTRGPIIVYNNGGGQSGTKENPSVAYQIKINNQMLKILNQLNLTIDNAGAGGDEFDGL